MRFFFILACLHLRVEAVPGTLCSSAHGSCSTEQASEQQAFIQTKRLHPQQGSKGTDTDIRAATPTTTTQGVPQYIVAAWDTNYCPSGYGQIFSSDVCLKAAAVVGIPYTSEDTYEVHGVMQSVIATPVGCSTTKDSKRAFFNNKIPQLDADALRAADVAPICEMAPPNYVTSVGVCAHFQEEEKHSIKDCRALCDSSSRCTGYSNAHDEKMNVHCRTYTSDFVTGQGTKGQTCYTKAEAASRASQAVSRHCPADFPYCSKHDCWSPRCFGPLNPCKPPQMGTDFIDGYDREGTDCNGHYEGH